MRLSSRASSLFCLHIALPLAPCVVFRLLPQCPSLFSLSSPVPNCIPWGETNCWVCFQYEEVIESPVDLFHGPCRFPFTNCFPLSSHGSVSRSRPFPPCEFIRARYSHLTGRFAGYHRGVSWFPPEIPHSSCWVLSVLIVPASGRRLFRADKTSILRACFPNLRPEWIPRRQGDRPSLQAVTK